jgi:hypothetical protein
MKTCDNLSIKHIYRKTEDPFLTGFPQYEKINCLCTLDSETPFPIVSISASNDHINLVLLDGSILSVKAKSYSHSQEEET